MFAVIMALKVVCVLVCLFTLAIISTEAGIPKCCMATTNFVPLHMLQRVQRWEMQSGSGACDVAALVLHLRNERRPICAHPKLWRAVIQLTKKRRRSLQRRHAGK
ncbi:C-C motif chemokine 27a [Genypterus blacodes]|uniref:C-C motif chemokine 27a n=1 Tax=Genypterus blacodes TaxID=154954 RepID=UPI003F76581F